eukprot:2109883-Rhodomonas_salina.1
MATMAVVWHTFVPQFDRRLKSLEKQQELARKRELRMRMQHFALSKSPNEGALWGAWILQVSQYINDIVEMQGPGDDDATQLHTEGVLQLYLVFLSSIHLLHAITKRAMEITSIENGVRGGTDGGGHREELELCRRVLRAVGEGLDLGPTQSTSADAAGTGVDLGPTQSTSADAAGLGGLKDISDLIKARKQPLYTEIGCAFQVFMQSTAAAGGVSGLFSTHSKLARSGTEMSGRDWVKKMGNSSEQGGRISDWCQAISTIIHDRMTASKLPQRRYGHDGNERTLEIISEWSHGMIEKQPDELIFVIVAALGKTADRKVKSLSESLLRETIHRRGLLQNGVNQGASDLPRYDNATLEAMRKEIASETAIAVKQSIEKQNEVAMGLHDKTKLELEALRQEVANATATALRQSIEKQKEVENSLQESVLLLHDGTEDEFIRMHNSIQTNNETIGQMFSDQKEIIKKIESEVEGLQKEMKNLQTQRVSQEPFNTEKANSGLEDAKTDILPGRAVDSDRPVSYTHLTLPTICSV